MRAGPDTQKNDASSSHRVQSKRARVQRLMARSGLLSTLWSQLRPGLYVFNYHRIGNHRESEFDPNVYSCNAELFAGHVELLRSRFRIVNTAELVDILANGQSLTSPLAMITFDDGYRDNYTDAFPVLVKAGASASFFLPTAFIGTQRIQWWDEIAWLMKNTALDTVEASFIPTPVRIDKANTAPAIQAVLTAFKRSPTSSEDKVAELRSKLGITVPDDRVKCLCMNWDEAREMAAAGMDIGSHSHSHRILSHLSVADQATELTLSKRRLEEELGARVNSVAYPVGAEDSFSRDTMQLSQDAGYKVGFSFINGVNYPSRLQAFELRRIAVDGYPNNEDLMFATLASTESARWVMDALRTMRSLV